MTVPEIIPQPNLVEAGTGQFQLDVDTSIGAPVHDHPAASLLAAWLRAATGWPVPVQVGAGTIRLVRDSTLSAAGDEGYELTCDDAGIRIIAATDAGLLWGVQTLRQLLPAAIESPTSAPGSEFGTDWAVAAVRVVDKPRFSWRGGHLDVSRHFFDVAFVKRFIDLLALHKMNVFHWHLTDDQGWRLEIEAWPKLTSVGGWRHPDGGGRHGGSYTQDEARDVVAYAAARGVTVVPEIELPGHALAALAGYPQFACTDGPFQVTGEWGVFDDVFCVGNDSTLDFLRSVLDEVLDIFPSPFIHVGGDECPKVRWQTCDKCQARMKAEGLATENELQSWTIRQFDRYLSDRGRRLVGWDEILEGGLAPGATVMSWRGVEGGLEAAQAGHDVIMTPQTNVYLDRKHYDEEDEAGRLSVSTLANCYGFEPTLAQMTEVETQHVLGLQANVWSEGFDTQSGADRMIWPRMSAVAETGWSQPSDRDLDDFCRRFRHLAQQLDAMGVDYYRDRAIWPQGAAQ